MLESGTKRGRRGAAMLVLIVLVLLLAQVASLTFMGRIPWSERGIGLWTSDAWGRETSQLFADPYSSSHVLHGMIFFALLFFVARWLPLSVRFLIAVLLEIGWELLENSPLIIDRYRAQTAALDYVGDSILNSVGDVLFCMFGFWLALRLPWKATLLLAIVIELVMLALYRDNLTLNILMLLLPLPAVKEWQMAQ